MGKELGYRPCVGIMLLDRQNRVWIGRRIDRAKFGESGARDYSDGHWWQMPQGGIDGDETPKAAARRELFEETGIRDGRVEILGKSRDWLTYDLPEELIGKIWGGRFRGQKQIWFAMRFLGEDSEFDIGARDGVKTEFDAWRWAPVSELVDVVVPFKRKLYETVLDEFRQFIEPV